jgi:Glycosyl-hydrolase family 116, catalytic region
MRRALEFQLRLDQDGDGVADLWGPGSCTYDTELYPHYGASSYVTSLYLAALRVVIRLAEERGESAYARALEARFARAQLVMERELFDEQRGYYICWRDTKSPLWTGERAHEPRSTSSHISQLAGAWWADMLGLEPIVDPQRRRRALAFIARHNVAQVAGSPADEYHLDGSAMQSMSALAMGNYAAHAIGAGLADEGWQAVCNIYRARYEHDGCPWDATLQWSGPGNLQPQWGRWYMSHPAAWFLLPSLGGVWIDRLRHRLTLGPSWPAEWGAQLRALPVLLPGLQLSVEAHRSAESLEVMVTVEQIQQPVRFDTVCVRLPSGFEARRAQVRIENGPQALRAGADALVTAKFPVQFARAGDRVAYSVGLV